MTQIINTKSSFVEKIFRDKNGRLVRAEFCVYENGGRIKARLVDFKYLDEPVQIKGKVLSLSMVMSKGTFDTKIRSLGFKIISPYFTFETLNFIGSKPRAPTFALVP